MLALTPVTLPWQTALMAGHCTDTTEPGKHFYEFSPIKCIFVNCLPSAPKHK